MGSIRRKLSGVLELFSLESWDSAQTYGFCEYFQIPYRTVTEWERDNRHAPEYVLRLLEYYIRAEKMAKNKEEEDRNE